MREILDCLYSYPCTHLRVAGLTVGRISTSECVNDGTRNCVFIRKMQAALFCLYTARLTAVNFACQDLQCIPVSGGRKGSQTG